MFSSFDQDSRGPQNQHQNRNQDENNWTVGSGKVHISVCRVKAAVLTCHMNLRTLSKVGTDKTIPKVFGVI